MSSIELCHSAKPHSSFDFEGLEESLVDNNDEDDDDDDFPEQDIHAPSTGMELDGFDHNLIMVRDALIRDSANRTEEDIEIIVRFLSAINSNHDHMTRKRLAPHFVLAEIESRDTRVLTHDEKLDAYCIVAAGSLRHVIPCGDEFLQETIGSPVDDADVHQLTNDMSSCQVSGVGGGHSGHQRVRYLHIGDEFGAHLNDRVVYGEIFTNENFVWVLCVPHVIFDQICGEKAFKTIKDEVTGNVIEMRTNCYLQLPDSPGINTIAPESDLNHGGSGLLPPISATTQYLPEEFNSCLQTDIVSSAVIPPKSLPLLPDKAAGSASLPNDNNELIRATKERLYELVLNSEPSEVFIEDFLLTFRIWAEKELSPSKDSVIMNDLMNRICNNIRTNVHSENCVRIVLLWMVNHFQDFQNENRYLLEEFENVLKEKGLRTHLRLFHMNLSAKSAERQVTVTRSDRNASLPFNLIGGYECSARLFVGEIINGHSQNSPQHQPALDLRPGDRVISINGVDCHVMPIGRAYDLCRSSTHLSLQVKYDPHLFNALIEGRYENKRQMVETFPLASRLSTSASTNFTATTCGNNSLSGSSIKDGKKEGNSTGNIWKQKVKSLVSMTTNQLINSTSNILNNNSNSNVSSNGGNSGQLLNNSSSSSSISSSSSSNMLAANQANSILQQNASSTHPRILSYEIPEIIKIYFFENNDCRFLPIHSSTTARECIQLALREFQLQSNYSSRDFALYEYSVIFNSGQGIPDENAVASSTVVKRMSDGTSDLVANLGLNSRLYLKLLIPAKDSNSSHHPLSDSDISKEIIKDTSTNSFLTLDTNSIARELTARDFRLFCKIEAQQFMYDLAYNNPNQPSNKNSCIIAERTNDLQEFERRTNEEMFWTINQILDERNRSVTKRVKVIKKLIRIANVAMKLNNFNLLFAILSGLNHSSVGRLKNCWDKVPGKDIKKLQKLKDLMSVTKNFMCLRQKLMEIMHQVQGTFIVIPFFPLVKKDLSFIWLANQTYVNSKEPQTPSSMNESTTMSKEDMLVNWEKMRLLSEKIREIQKMTNTTSLAMAAASGVSQSNGNAITSPSVANEPIDPNLLFRIFADATTAEDPRTFSHKRLWENQRMMKRIQSFLDETFGSVSSDEQELLSRSHSCELPQTPNSSHATTRSSIASTMSSNSQLSHPSPTPSSASSSSNSLSMHSDGTPGQLLYRPLRPRFGQSSPNNLRKLLALSDGSVIVPHNNHGNTSSSNQQQPQQQPHQQQTVPSGATTNSQLGGAERQHSQGHHPHSHHHHQYSQNSRSSTSSLNSSLSGSTNYYNSLYSHSYSVQHNSSANPGAGSNGGLATGNSAGYHPNSSSGAQPKLPYGQSQQLYPGGGGSCCPPALPSPQIAPPCCGVPQSGALYPNQSYCACCTPMMRSSVMPIMAPPQTSGLMHPACPCTPNHQSSRRQNSLPAKQPLPVESSSVTSFRRLEQYQQMTRYREIRSTSSSKLSSSTSRPQCPDYNTAIQRIHRQHRSNPQHHREDIV